MTSKDNSSAILRKNRIRLPSSCLVQMRNGFLVLTLESLEALQRNSGWSSDKLQQPGSTLLIEWFHSFPKPLHNVAVWCTMFESCVGLPVGYVNFTQSTHNQLHVEEKTTMWGACYMCKKKIRNWNRVTGRACKHPLASSSFSSKAFNRCWGMTSLNPFCRARNWASIPRRKRQLT